MPGSGAQHRSVPGQGCVVSHAGGVEQSSASGPRSAGASVPEPVSSLVVSLAVSLVVVSLALPVSLLDPVSLAEPVSVFEPVSVVDVSALDPVSPALVPVSFDDDDPSSLLEHAARQIAKSKEARSFMMRASLNGIGAGRQHAETGRDAGQTRDRGFS